MKIAGSTRASFRLTFQCRCGPVARPVAPTLPTTRRAAPRPHLHVDRRHVAEHADHALAVVQEHGLAIEEIISHQRHHASGRRLDRRAGRHGEIQPGMRIALFAVEDAPQAEGARQAATRHRTVQDEVAGRHACAIASVGRALLGHFTLDALHVLVAGIDLARVLQRDALRGVFLGRTVKASSRAPLASSMDTRCSPALTDRGMPTTAIH